MMPAEALLILRARGARIGLVDGNLAVTPRSALDPEIRETLRQAKPAVVAILKGKLCPLDATPVPASCAHCHGTIFWRADGTADLHCVQCQPAVSSRGCAWYFASSGMPLDVLLQPEVRAALDWLLREDALAANTILKLISAVDRGEGSSVTNLLAAVNAACDRFDSRLSSTEGSSR